MMTDEITSLSEPDCCPGLMVLYRTPAQEEDQDGYIVILVP